MKKTEKHTFTILAYKQSPYLEDCINSLLSQTVKSEIIITTSTSSKFLEEISEKYKIPLHINSEQKGIASDWNFAFKTAETKYVTLAHQDDIYKEKYLQKCLNKSERKDNKDNLITFTGYKELYKDKIRENNSLLVIKNILLFPYMFKDNLKTNFFKRLILLFGSPIPCPSVMYNKENLADFQFDETFTINMDWNAWIELANKKGSFVYESQKLLIHRIYSGSETSKGIEDNRRQNEDKRIFKKLWASSIAKIIAKLYSLSYRSNK